MFVDSWKLCLFCRSSWLLFGGTVCDLRAVFILWNSKYPLDHHSKIFSSCYLFSVNSDYSLGYYILQFIFFGIVSPYSLEEMAIICSLAVNGVTLKYFGRNSIESVKLSVLCDI